MPFKQIIGQDRVIRSLQNSLRRGSVSHAYLFVGPEGIGKKLTAFGLAKAVNCLQQDEDFCENCDSCRRIEKGVHPDFFLIEPDGTNLKVNQLRELQSSIQYKPYLAKRKVCIIDQAERMTPSAANSILKTLEEPPGDTLLILVTSNIERILPTIRSRCRIMPFSALLRHDLQCLIIEKTALSPDKAHILAALANGSLGRALSIDLDAWQEKRGKVLHVMENIGPSRPIEDLFAQAKKLAEGKNTEELYQLLDLWMYWYYDLWRYQISGDEKSLINIDQLENIHRQSQMMKRIGENIKLIEETCSALRRNANKQLTLEVLMIKLSQNNGNYHK